MNKPSLFSRTQGTFEAYMAQGESSDENNSSTNDCLLFEQSLPRLHWSMAPTAITNFVAGGRYSEELIFTEGLLTNQGQSIMGIRTSVSCFGSDLAGNLKDGCHNSLCIFAELGFHSAGRVAVLRPG